MIMNPKMSVIIPVYNVEEYIYECVNSIINQSFKDIEILVINDGTKDKSIEIVQKILDPRIRVINRINGGLSAARNTGIMNSNGKYLMFVDGDDYIIDNDAISNMYNIAEKYGSDIVVGNSIKVYEDGSIEKFYRKSEIFKEVCMYSYDFLKVFMENDSMQIPVWMNLYKRDKLIDNSLLFEEGILHEDELFTPQVFLYANRIAIYPNEFYAYRQRKGSIMFSNNRDKRILDMFYILNKLISIYEQLDDKKIFDLLMKRVYWHILNIVNTTDIKKVPYNLRKIMLKNSKGIKSILLNTLLFLDINIYRKVLIIFEKI